MIKAVFFDMDGTLLTNTNRLLPSTVTAIKDLKEQGVIVGLATGRGPSFVASYMENYGFDCAVTFNGQYILTRDKKVYTNPFPKTAIVKLLTYAKDHQLELSFGTESGLMGSRLINYGTTSKIQVLGKVIPKKWAKALEKSFKHTVRRLRPQNYDKLKALVSENIYQAIVVASPEKTRHLEQAIPYFSATRSSPYSADIISKGQSKLRGIARLAEYYEFDLYEVMAFGDSDNDRDMLENVGIGVAMGNSAADLKQVAHYTTTDNNTDGIANALIHYGLIRPHQKEERFSEDPNANKVRDFHQLMDGSTRAVPQLFSQVDASHRADFKLEELVEFLYATTQGQPVQFDQAVSELHQALDKAVAKVQQKSAPTNPLVGQVDALTDLLYLTYGSFVLMGVDPKPFFDIVHTANMEKIFPDGKAHFDPITHKILKPDHWEERFAPEPAISRELDRQIRKALTNTENT